MKKLLPLLLISAVSSVSEAALPVSGYYRVQNATTSRYVYVRDNKGDIDVGATTADYDAIWLLKDVERIHYDASGIIRLNHKSGNEYDIESQGTSVYKLIEMYPHIYDRGNGLYKIGGTAHGTTKYLSDGEGNLEKERSFPRDGGGAQAVQRQNWKIMPVEESYFGIKPTVRATDGKYYGTIYADFPFTTLSEGMKVYVVTKFGNGMAAIKEVNGRVPVASPLLIECSGSTPADNQLSIGGNSNANLAGNMLTGVYFDNTDSKKHWNVVNYDPQTMRVLGLTSDGNAGFVTAGSDLKYLPANTAYLKVPAGTAAELRLVSEEEFESSAIDDVAADRSAGVNIEINGLDVTLYGNASSAVDIEIIDVAGHVVAATALTPSSSCTITLPAHGLYILRTPKGARKFLL
ncbi:hypothetical protein [uncultured Muribaculum sp.]|nr:hypothetical protein [uncultured Muribaculum sp.]